MTFTQTPIDRSPQLPRNSFSVGTFFLPQRALSPCVCVLGGGGGEAGWAQFLGLATLSAGNSWQQLVAARCQAALSLPAP